MTIFGVDISSYQGSGFNFAQAKTQGVSFSVIKATEGDNYVNPSYNTQAQNSLNAGLLTMSYHFVHSADENGQVAEVERYVRKDLPVWLDSEVDGSGEYGVSVDLVRRLRADGWNVVGTYLPRWFWSQIGSPDMRPLGLLWASGYPGGTGSPAQIYQGDGNSNWNAYGNVNPSLWQFTNQASVAGQLVDCSAYRGTVQQLSALVNNTSQVDVGDMTNYIVKLSTAVTNNGVTTFPDAATQDGELVSSVTWSNASATIAKQNGGGLTGLTDAEWNDRVAKSSLMTAIQPALVQLDTDVKANTAVLQQILAVLQSQTTSGAPTAAAVAQAVVVAEDAERVTQLNELGFVPKTS